MKRILVICPFPERLVPGQRLKYEQYFEYLRSHGYDVTVSPFYSEDVTRILHSKGNAGRKALGVAAGYLRRARDLVRATRYDGIYLFLWATPIGTPFFEFLFRLSARKVVYDIDDLVFLGHASQANAFMRLLKWRSKYTFLMKHAEHVVTCTPYLDEFVRNFNSNTTDISSTINTETYQARRNYAVSGPLTLGWSGSVTTSVYLKLLEGVLRRLRQTHEFKLLVIGNASFRFDAPIEGLEIEALPWKEATEVADLGRIDIGLYPLPNEQWVLGKSGLKALQYMALGIPTVATAIGANHRVIEDGQSGFLVSSDAEWIERLTRLLTDGALREKLGRAARERVEKQYSVKANEPTYLGIFQKIYGQP